MKDNLIEVVGVVYNTCFGGAGLSELGLKRYNTLAGTNHTSDFELFYDDRTDPFLVKVIETLGSEKASADYANLEIRYIPKGTKYYIVEYDGVETVITPDDDDLWEIA